MRDVLILRGRDHHHRLKFPLGQIFFLDCNVDRPLEQFIDLVLDHTPSSEIPSLLDLCGPRL